MRKEDLYLIARWRKLPYTSPSLWKMSVEELRALVLPATADETGALEKQDVERSKIGKKTIPELKQELTSRGLVASAGITKGGMMDLLIDPKNAAPVALCPNLDEFQSAAVTKALEMGAIAREGGPPQTLLISAGPGAGKTTTVVHMLKQLVEASLRVLVLAFNVEAEKVLHGRAKAAGLKHVQLIPKNALWSTGPVPGVAILTFDKYAYQVLAEERAAAEQAAYFGTTVTATVPDEKSYDFRENKERAARLLMGKSLAPPRFDVIVVDESQDVTSLEAGLVGGTLSGSTKRPLLVCAGDPRQEIYTGAVWFSNMWSMQPAPGIEKLVLSNNYRSHPQIVATLNAFSKHAFPTLHHDQIAARCEINEDQVTNEDQERRVIIITTPSPQEVGRIAARHMSTRKPEESYAISPVSIEKFKIGSSTAAIRQELHELVPGTIAMALTGNARIPAAKAAGKNAAAFLMATSRKIKGTEREQVVIYGADRSFINVDRPALAKLLYVAISRAREELVIINYTERGKLINCEATELMMPVTQMAFVSSPIEVSKMRRGRPSLLPLPVTSSIGAGPEGGRSHCAAPFPLQMGGEKIGIHKIKVPKIQTDNASHDSDFLGCLVEAHVVGALGLKLLSADNLEYKREENRAQQGVTFNIETMRYQIRTSASTIESLQKAFPAINGTPYHHALITFSTLCGKAWTVSERFLGPDAQKRLETGAAAVAKQLRMILEKSGDETELRHWEMFQSSTVDCRGACPSAGARPIISSGIPDLQTERCVIELKHCNEIGEMHRRQLMTYMALRGRRLGILYNTKTGEAELFGTKDITPFRIYAGCVAKIVSFITQARSIGIWLGAPRVRMPDLEANTLISLDVETDDGGRLTEIGAIAVSLTDFSVLSIFQERARGVVPIPSENRMKKTRVEEITNLHAGEEFTQSAEQDLIAAFKSWLIDFPGATVLHWGGSERMLVGDTPCVDCLSKVFNPWLEYRDQARTGACSLTCAMEQILPELSFVPHQALEDAAATLAIFTALVDTSGAL